MSKATAIELIGALIIGVGMWVLSYGALFRERVYFTAAAFFLGFIVMGMGVVTATWWHEFYY